MPVTVVKPPVPDADVARTFDPDPLGDIDVTPDEVHAILQMLREKKRAERAVAEAAVRQRETGYPKRLYNPKFPFESIQFPNSTNRIAFHRGVLDVPDEETETFIRLACPTRIYEADMPQEKVCTRCNRFVTANMDCWTIHMESHTP